MAARLELVAIVFGSVTFPLERVRFPFLLLRVYANCDVPA